MTLHLVKLCVGIESVDHLAEVQRRRRDALRAAGLPVEQIHKTRMIPRRQAELLDGGSLYWVIRGNIQARQAIWDIREGRDETGRRCCHLVLDPKLVPTRPLPHRPFQGWRYLDPAAAPEDMPDLTDDLAAVPPAMRAELLRLCLL